MSLIWAAVFFLSGIAIYLVLPVALAPILPWRVRKGLSGWYYRQAAAVGNRLQIVERDHGTHTLLTTNYRAEWGDEGVLDDETGHWRDNGNHMGRFHGRPMGLVSERYDVVAHPRHCEIGREHRRLAERGMDEVELTLRQGEDTMNVLAAEMRAALPTQPRAVSAHDIEGVLGDSGGPRLGETSYEYAKKSQSRFGKRNVVEIMTFVLAYGASFGMMWFFAEQSGAVTQSIPI